MGNFIYISIRRNLLYVLNLIIYYYLRKVVLIIIERKYNFNNSLIFTFLMLFGEFSGGLSLYIYNSRILKKDKKKETRVFGLKLIQKEVKMKTQDSKIKIIILIFFAAFFDFVEFIIASFYMPRFPIISQTAEYRFGGIIIIIGALLCYYNLKMSIKKHHLVSLIIVSVCLLIIITLEIIYRGRGASPSDFLFGHLIVLGYLTFVPFTDIIEKYLLEFNFMNPFFILIMESIFGFILITIYSIGEDLFKDTKRLYEERSTGEFILLVFLFFLYLAFSAGANVYKIITNGLYSPMTKTLAVYILNPLIYTYYFALGSDFLLDKERNWFYFLTNIIIALIISFFVCVFNEFIVLKFCGLDHDTHHEITRRATSGELEGRMTELDSYLD
jgi:hypothetical protein